ncbi:DEAD/DEAH box helicase family protein [Salinimicrobium sp. MT39]|uniref:DEAD/DEAH box helicase family protein n=1 Tax=Salinimicrobium profundisediminis TaxID=2994553 RepID=A0A9X3I142_9FLAO|nr:DEAD/DEAH box helicase family protein [Salinimicrobium profundisediminis]MCX2837562.1 DEAD/DEAH box helicase family protein [Salinimicrobium profundisediminis]
MSTVLRIPVSFFNKYLIALLKEQQVCGYPFYETDNLKFLLLDKLLGKYLSNMVDFKKKLNKPEIEKKTDPIEIYDSLDRRSIAGPLRPAQFKILNEWYDSRKDEKDLIIKLHTGEGKTLIGLLILQSKINSGQSPCLYVCPNKYLVQQVKRDARKFGISFCSFEDDGSFPNEFIDGEKILITHVQKVFNGKTKFGLGKNYVHVENIILDDSHACIDSIKNTFTISVKRDDEIYKEFFELFKDFLPEQGQGTFLEIENGEYDSFLPIPYWNWIDKSEEILNILSTHREENDVAFSWPFIKDNIINCQAFISGNSLEISPIHIPIDKFSSFNNASQRVLMSATTQDDSFFIKGLGFKINSIKNPLHNPDQIWSGEKMLVIPSLVHDSLDRDKIVTVMSKPYEKHYGVVSLVSSFKKSTTYKALGSIVPKSEEIGSVVDHLKKSNFKNTVVFANRYDGIDLPDETCRILILDSKPYFFSLADRYEEANRQGSDSLNIKIAQKIEQGLGRSVRGEKDFCLILVIGADLVKFLKSSRTNKYFSPQTQKQIEIGIEIAKMAEEDIPNENQPFDVIRSLMKQSLQRDEGWKEFYREEMNKISSDPSTSKIHEIFSLERKASEHNYIGEYEKACEVMQDLIDNYVTDIPEKGWYLQTMARYKYLSSKHDSNNLQKSAFSKNNELLKPREGITYKKLDFITEERTKRIFNWIKQHENFEELNLAVDSILSDLTFGTSAEKFEAAFKELGLMLGFLSERPDKEIKKGPDNLWCGSNNQYFIFECKSEVDLERQEISKYEAGQMNSHCGWFESQYSDSPVKKILIIPTKSLSYHANFTHDVEIMRRGKLKHLRTNVKAFFKEFQKYEIHSITDELIQSFIATHKLDIESLKVDYSEGYNQALR